MTRVDVNDYNLVLDDLRALLHMKNTTPLLLADIITAIAYESEKRDEGCYNIEIMVNKDIVAAVHFHIDIVQENRYVEIISVDFTDIKKACEMTLQAAKDILEE